jgi:signal transduction histidine kinase
LRSQAQRATTALGVLAQEDLEHPDRHDLARLARRYREETDAEVLVVDATGKPVVILGPGSEGVGDRAAETRAALAGAASVHSITDEGKPVEVAAQPVRRPDGSIGGAVVVSIPGGTAAHRIAMMIVALLALAAAVLVAAVAIGLVLARSVARPLAELEDAAGHVGAGDLGARVRTTGPAELRSVASTFNQMADRLDELITSQRRFVADASHQLRSPLTALRLRLESVDPDDAGATRRHLEAATDEVARLSRLVDGLLALARNEGARPNRVEVDVGDTIDDRAQMWGALAAERNVRLDVDRPPDPTLAWDVPGHLEQVLDNLLANALEAAPERSTVNLAVARTGERVEVRVQVTLLAVGLHQPVHPELDLERAGAGVDRGARGRERRAVRRGPPVAVARERPLRGAHRVVGGVPAAVEAVEVGAPGRLDGRGVAEVVEVQVLDEGEVRDHGGERVVELVDQPAEERGLRGQAILRHRVARGGSARICGVGRGGDRGRDGRRSGHR